MSREEATHAASIRRRRQAREQGQVTLSREVVFGVLMGATLVFAAWQGPQVWRQLQRMIRESIHAAGTHQDSHALVESMSLATVRFAIHLLPVLTLICVAVIVGHMIQCGVLWLPNRLIPDVNRINPSAGFQRLRQRAPFVTTVLGLIKLVCVGGAGLWFVSNEIESIFRISDVPLQQTLYVAAPLAFRFAVHLLGGYLVFSIFDYWAAHWRNEERIRMTEEEKRDEIKAVRNDVHRR